MSILDKLERRESHASDVISEKTFIQEELNPKDYQFLLNVTFVPEIFTYSKIIGFTSDLRSVFEAHLSDYEIFLRDMSFEYPKYIHRFPIIEQDNLKMLKASNMECFVLRYDKEVWLFAQFNIPAKARVLCRFFCELCKICRKYEIGFDNTNGRLNGFRMHQRHMQIIDQGIMMAQEYAKMCYDNNWKLDPEIIKSWGVQPITIIYTFKTEITQNWEDFKDFEYMFEKELTDSSLFAANICYDMFSKPMKEELEKYYENRR